MKKNEFVRFCEIQDERASRGLVIHGILVKLRDGGQLTTNENVMLTNWKLVRPENESMAKCFENKEAFDRCLAMPRSGSAEDSWKLIDEYISKNGAIEKAPLWLYLKYSKWGWLWCLIAIIAIVVLICTFVPLH